MVVEAAELDDQRQLTQLAVVAQPGHDLLEETKAVAERAAILVGSIVDRPAEELGEQIAIARMQFDAVEPGLLHAMGGGDELRDHRLDLGLRHRAAANALEIVALAGRRQRRSLPILNSGVVLLTPRIGELQEIFALARSSFVHLPAEFGPERNLVVVIDEGVVRQDAAMQVNWNVRGNERAGAAARERGLEIDPPLRARSVVVVDPGGEARAKNAVLDLHPTDLEWFEYPGRSHAGTPVTTSHHAIRGLRTIPAEQDRDQRPENGAMSRKVPHLPAAIAGTPRIWRRQVDHRYEPAYVVTDVGDVAHVRMAPGRVCLRPGSQRPEDLQGEREAQQAVALAVQDGLGRHHLRVQQRPPRQQPMEEPAMVRPLLSERQRGTENVAHLTNLPREAIFQ